MKRAILRSFYQLQILEDGSSLYNWVHPFNTRLLLRSNDITVSLSWNKTEPNLELIKKIELASKSGSELDSESGYASD